MTTTVPMSFPYVQPAYCYGPQAAQYCIPLYYVPVYYVPVYYVPQNNVPQPHQDGIPQPQQCGVPQDGVPQPQQCGVPQDGVPQPQQCGVPQNGVPQPHQYGVPHPFQYCVPQFGVLQPQQYGVPQYGVPQYGVPQPYPYGVPGPQQYGVPQAPQAPQFHVPQQSPQSGQQQQPEMPQTHEMSEEAEEGQQPEKEQQQEQEQVGQEPSQEQQQEHGHQPEEPEDRQHSEREQPEQVQQCAEPELDESHEQPEQVQQCAEPELAESHEQPEQVHQCAEPELEESHEQPEQVQLHEEVQQHEEVQLHEEVQQHEEVQLHEEVQQHEEVQLHEEVQQHEEVQLHEEVQQHEEVQLHEEVQQHDEVQLHEEPQKCESLQQHDQPEQGENSQHQQTSAQPERQPEPEKKPLNVLNVSANSDVQLNKCATAWRPGFQRRSTVKDPEAQETEELLRKFRSILNKLTPEKFDRLIKQVTELPIDTEERLRGVVELIYEKAIDELNFATTYGKMCCCLATLKVQMPGKPNSTVSFQKLLLNCCQKEFDKDRVDDATFERKQKEVDSAASSTERRQLQEELEEAKCKARRRSIGNIKFIGELYNLKMLTGSIMHECVGKLFKINSEESLECLCRLLTTSGQTLDLVKSKSRMDQHFTQIETIIKERKTSSRIRFMLQDVVDLRLNNWVPRRAIQGPKTISQLHMEAEMEHVEEQRKVLQHMDFKRQTDLRSQRELDYQPEETVRETIYRDLIDPNKILKFLKAPVGEETQLHMPDHHAWKLGGRGWGKSSDSDILLCPQVQRQQPLQSMQEAPQTEKKKIQETPQNKTKQRKGCRGRRRAQC